MDNNSKNEQRAEAFRGEFDYGGPQVNGRYRAVLHGRDDVVRDKAQYLAKHAVNQKGAEKQAYGLQDAVYFNAEQERNRQRELRQRPNPEHKEYPELVPRVSVKYFYRFADESNRTEYCGGVSGQFDKICGFR
jgi:hypothetical protein